jgi:hypothetical protein
MTYPVIPSLSYPIAGFDSPVIEGGVGRTAQELRWEIDMGWEQYRAGYRNWCRNP